MFNVLLPRVSRQNGSFQRYLKATSVFLLLLMVGCSRERSPQAELSLTVEPSNRPGVYVVSGKTNLPDQSRIVVQGIRPLTSAAQTTSTEESPNYVILDRQAVVASQGQWQTTLKLWQSTPDGQDQELWQANQAQISRLKPSTDVVFVATIDSTNQTKASAQPLDLQGKPLQGANIHFTTGGQWSLQAKQTLAVSPPMSKTASSAFSANDFKANQNPRSEQSNVSVNATSVNLPVSQEKQTTAPLSFSQRLR